MGPKTDFFFKFLHQSVPIPGFITKGFDVEAEIAKAQCDGEIFKGD